MKKTAKPGWHSHPGLYIDLDGNPVRHPPWKYHYSYDEYVTHKHDLFRPTDGMDYSDRLYQYDPEKFRNAASRTWPDAEPHSQMFHDKEPEDVQKFLSLYFGHEIVLTAILKGCDLASGNPYWVFAHREPDGKEDRA